MPLNNWSTTPLSNSSAPPYGAPELTTTLAQTNNIMRQIMADTRQLAATSTIASAATCDIGANDATFLTVTGTTGITSLGSTGTAGLYKWLVFEGALTLTHNATSLILPGDEDLSVTAGDVLMAVCESAGNWRVISFQPKYEFTQRKSVYATGVAATDVAAIQAAITAADDYTVIELFGGFATNATITVKPKLMLVGNYATITHSNNAADVFAYTAGTPTGYPGRIIFDHLTITGPGNTGSAYAIKVDANSPFVQVRDCFITSIYGGVYLRDCYCSSIEDTSIATCTHGIQLVRESHASILRNNFVDGATVAALSLNYGGGAGTGAIHNISVVGGAYQNSAVGIWMENAYGVHTLNVYHEGNTTNDYKIGVHDAGVYARAAYGITIDGFESSSACAGDKNIAISHAVGVVVNGAAWNSGCSTTATLLKADGACDRVSVNIHRHTTATPTDTAPVDFTDDPGRFVLYYRGRPLYSYADTGAIKFGTLATDRARVYFGDGISARASLILEAQEADTDVLFKVAAGVGQMRFADDSGVEYFSVDPVNGRTNSYVPLKIKEYTVATLPASGAYSRAFVTDANATTFNSVVAGGGANKVPVFHDGTDWRIG